MCFSRNVNGNEQFLQENIVTIARAKAQHIEAFLDGLVLAAEALGCQLKGYIIVPVVFCLFFVSKKVDDTTESETVATNVTLRVRATSVAGSNNFNFMVSLIVKKWE